jgi:hypothetical protein
MKQLSEHLPGDRVGSVLLAPDKLTVCFVDAAMSANVWVVVAREHDIAAAPPAAMDAP